MIAPRVIGIIFPILPDHVKRLLLDRKKIFVKFVSKDLRRLRIGGKLFLYESRGTRTIVGEAEIEDIARATAAEVVSKYGHDLFLTTDELEKYVGNRTEKRMLVLAKKGAKISCSPKTQS